MHRKRSGKKQQIVPSFRIIFLRVKYLGMFQVKPPTLSNITLSPNIFEDISVCFSIFLFFPIYFLVFSFLNVFFVAFCILYILSIFAVSYRITRCFSCFSLFFFIFAWCSSSCYICGAFFCACYHLSYFPRSALEPNGNVFLGGGCTVLNVTFS